MHPQLALALEPVLRDLRATGGPLPRVVPSDWPGDGGVAGAMLWHSDGSGSGISVVLDRPAAEQVAHVTDVVHDWVVEELWGTAPTNWPPCPGHPESHPLEVRRSGDAVEWVCPADGTAVRRVGDLG
ncbi:hypothetical protein DQ244_17760 [Blastococcus sp. TBT05-19]|uniref:hypothetical protein n=1 Tax=Blastococcus sp. TBT05-19 TaxID=2250581 RepID=UPI000DEA0180|nr:hypothetical protein [Blastococcus sp. TBT05-19]RBY87171.1 hypothetical protein DQ244_17760 [Blastococcus sp. TBT05-19]